MCGLRSLISLLANLLADDVYYQALRTESISWDVGTDPAIIVDFFDGYISVVQSTDGKVTAVIKRIAVTKGSQSAADAALGLIGVSKSREGDTIRIATRPALTVRASQLQADVELRVPEYARLELLTGEGYIYIGHRWGGPSGAYLITSPVKVRSVKARTLGRTYNHIDAEFVKEPSDSTASSS